MIRLVLQRTIQHFCRDTEDGFERGSFDPVLKNGRLKNIETMLKRPLAGARRTVMPTPRNLTWRERSQLFHP